MSSLEQTLNNAANRLKLKKLNDNNNSKQNGGRCSGAFENSFARGLDISEFLSTSAQSTSRDRVIDDDQKGLLGNQRTSAAEELLKIKEGERHQREIQEKEEEKMQEALQKRLDSFKQQQARNKDEVRKKSSFEIGDALVRMHGTDEISAAILSQKVNTRKSGTGGFASRRQNSTSRRTSHKSNKSSVAKKSRHAKY